MFRKNPVTNIMTVFAFAVAALILVLGIYIMFLPQLANLPKEYKSIFGIVIIGYGLFRMVIIYQKSKQRRRAEDEAEF